MNIIIPDGTSLEPDVCAEMALVICDRAEGLDEAVDLLAMCGLVHVTPTYYTTAIGKRVRRPA